MKSKVLWQGLGVQGKGVQHVKKKTKENSNRQNWGGGVVLCTTKNISIISSSGPSLCVSTFESFLYH